VVNRGGRPVANFLVDFVVTSGGGQVFGGAEETDRQGYVDELWTLGGHLGPQTLEVRSVDPITGVAVTYGTFTATALPPHNIPVVITNAIGVAIMNADGTNLRQLTSDGLDIFPGEEACAPDLSPDHRTIAFTTTRSGSQQVWTMGADGSHPTQLTKFGGRRPRWSPDGQRLVYDRGDNLYITGPAGGDGFQVSFGPGSHGPFFEGATLPAWSPDGRQIAFSDATSQDVFILTLPLFVVDSTGDNIRNLTNTVVGEASQPAWSPDGTKIAYVSGRGIYTVDVDGSNLRQVLNSDLVSAWQPVTWSPDGTLIGSSVGLMNADGTGLTPINGGAAGVFPWR
jgi:Tol biopolymer transport system component